MEFIKWKVQGLDENHNPKGLEDIFGMFRLNQIDLREDVFGGESKIRDMILHNALFDGKNIRIDEWEKGIIIGFNTEDVQEFEKINTTLFNNIIRIIE